MVGLCVYALDKHALSQHTLFIYGKDDGCSVALG